MDVQRLREAYNSDANVTSICDEMASRERNQSETKLSRILARLTNNGSSVRKHEAIAAFRKLEECGCGQYIVGRHGWPSRFVWSVSSLSACQAARGMGDSVDPLPETDDEIETEIELDAITHYLRLRDDFEIELQLPDDLTQREADRICSFVNALPIDD